MIEKASITKRKIMLKIAQDDEIIKLLNNPKVEYNEDLIGTTIFPYLKIDGTMQESKVCIGVAVNFPSVNKKNKLFKNTTVTILVMCDNGVLNMSNGSCRTDLLIERVCEIINWNDWLGFDMELVYDDEAPFNENLYTREVQFKSLAHNNTLNGNRINR